MKYGSSVPCVVAVSLVIHCCISFVFFACAGPLCGVGAVATLALAPTGKPYFRGATFGLKVQATERRLGAAAKGVIFEHQGPEHGGVMM